MSSLPAPPAEPGLEIASQREHDSLRLLLAGDLDRASAWALTASVIRSEREHASRVVLDVSGVVFIDAGGLRAIADAARRTKRRGRGFAVAKPSPHIARLLRLTGLTSSIEVVEGAAVDP